MRKPRNIKIDLTMLLIVVLESFFPLQKHGEFYKEQATRLKTIRDPFEIWGDFDEPEAANLVVVFDKCCTNDFYDRTGKKCYHPQEKCAGYDQCEKKCAD